MAATSAAVDPSDRTLRMHTIGGTTNTPNPLERQKIYAMSINYRKVSDQYFAAREAYVWPSDRSAYGGERIGTFPLMHFLTNKTYSYHFCDQTFVPDGTRRTDWQNLIEAALEHWESATLGLITVERVPTPCTNYDSVIMKLESDIRKEIKRQTMIGADVNLVPFVSGLMTSLKNTRVVRSTNDVSLGRNEIYMYNDIDGPTRFFLEQEVFSEIASGIGYGCWRNEDGKRDPAALACAPWYMHDGKWQSDIVVRRSAFDRSNHLYALGRAIDDPLHIPVGSVRFNTCTNRANEANSAYEVMVHEGAHVLGIAGGSSVGWANPQHPQVADSVANYDFRAVSKVPGVPPVELRDFDESFAEPDCAPHPLDVMAIYALYQTD